MKKIKPVNQIKLVLLGETGVGKTSIMQRFVENKFEDKSTASIGIDFSFKTMKYKKKSYSIQIFDTAGQERFKSIAKTYYHMGEGFLIVFDLSNNDSLNALKDWIEDVKENVDDPKFIILGNKDDLQKSKKLSDDIIKKQLENYKDIIYIKTSAKANTNIKETFEKMIDLLEKDNNVQIKQGKKSKKDNSIIINENNDKYNENEANSQCC